MITGVVTNETGVGGSIDLEPPLTCVIFDKEVFEGPGVVGVGDTFARLVLALSCRLISSASCTSTSLEDGDWAIADAMVPVNCD